MGTTRHKTSKKTSYPQTEGISERFIQTLKQMITAYVDQEQFQWDLNLNKFAYAYNNSIHATTGFTPFEIQFGSDH